MTTTVPTRKPEPRQRFVERYLDPASRPGEIGSKLDIRRGSLVGFKYKKVDFTTYWLGPGSKDATFVFTLAVTFNA